MKRKQSTSELQTLIPFKKQRTQEPTAEENDHKPFIEQAIWEKKELTQALVHYCPRFLTPSFSKQLFEHLKNDVTFSQSKIQLYGREFNTPRLQSWMSDPGVSAQLYQDKEALPWSPEVLLIKEEVERITNFQFDYVLLNLYRGGSDYISYHSDKEAIGPNKNVIASVSVGQERKFVLRHNKWKEKDIKKEEFILTDGSLIIMIGDDTQKYWKHSVPKTAKTIGRRYNLTFRHS